MNETSATTPPEWCQPGDLENFVLLLSGLRESLAEDQGAQDQGAQEQSAQVGGAQGQSAQVGGAQGQGAHE
ncbi:hypothetical protein ABH930_003258 [Kitasatospora sp. GAS204A]|uniref:hypothetical protein n=1 Tax=unclassified Kitasatospora TaxID=2633591 RepID=UPI0024769C6B|nr:hypothetical protein [Kitasatospora sp. GAS204B]MDH6118019.1 hypothetical protein [Kitasatospora sp. GAS204B]